MKGCILKAVFLIGARWPLVSHFKDFGGNLPHKAMLPSGADGYQKV